MKILNLKEKEQTYPLIEILAPIDAGKTGVAKLVSKRLYGNFIAFPILDPRTSTGRALLSSLTTNLRELERSPDWWAHVFAAHLYEHRDKIIALRSIGPVFVTNYLTAYRVWMRQLGTEVNGFVSGLPRPSLCYNLYGASLPPTPNSMHLDFAPDFKHRIKRSFAAVAGRNTIRVPVPAFAHDRPYSFYNSICASISSDIALRFSLEHLETEFYKHSDFIG